MIKYGRPCYGRWTLYTELNRKTLRVFARSPRASHEPIAE